MLVIMAVMNLKMVIPHEVYFPQIGVSHQTKVATPAYIKYFHPMQCRLIVIADSTKLHI